MLVRPTKFEMYLKSNLSFEKSVVPTRIFYQKSNYLPVPTDSCVLPAGTYDILIIQFLNRCLLSSTSSILFSSETNYYYQTLIKTQ